MKTISLLTILAAAATILTEDRPESMTSLKTEAATAQLMLSPVGHVEKQRGRSCIRVDPHCQAALLGLEQWSHIWVLYWFDRNDTPEKRSVLQVHPRGKRENPLTGVFATRSPLRPNLIGLSLCRVLSVKEKEVEIESIDAFDQTPVIDIKPFIPEIDRPQGKLTTPGWVSP